MTGVIFPASGRFVTKRRIPPTNKLGMSFFSHGPSHVLGASLSHQFRPMKGVRDGHKGGSSEGPERQGKDAKAAPVGDRGIGP
jgi:hypothetical protein